MSLLNVQVSEEIKEMLFGEKYCNLEVKGIVNEIRERTGGVGSRSKIMQLETEICREIPMQFLQNPKGFNIGLGQEGLWLFLRKEKKYVEYNEEVNKIFDNFYDKLIEKDSRFRDVFRDTTTKRKRNVKKEVLEQMDYIKRRMNSDGYLTSVENIVADIRFGDYFSHHGHESSYKKIITSVGSTANGQFNINHIRINRNFFGDIS